MAVPDFQSLMRPVLALSDGREWSTADLRNALSDQFGLSDEERAQLQPSGSGRLFDNRWAGRTHTSNTRGRSNVCDGRV